MRATGFGSFGGNPCVVVRSIWFHVAFRTSPLLVAVRVRILNAAMVAQWALDSSMVLMAALTLLWCSARMWLRRVLFLPNPARMAALGSDSKKPSAIAHFMMAPIRWRSLRAVSGFWCHMGVRHFMMSLLVTSWTCLCPMWGNTWVLRLDSQIVRLRLPGRHLPE